VEQPQNSGGILNQFIPPKEQKEAFQTLQMN